MGCISFLKTKKREKSPGHDLGCKVDLSQMLMKAFLMLLPTVFICFQNINLARGSEKLLATVTIDTLQTYMSPAVSAHIGTQGLGLEINIPANSRLSLRFGGSFLPLNFATVRNFGNQNARLKMDANFNNVHTMADVQPFVRSGRFFV